MQGWAKRISDKAASAVEAALERGRLVADAMVAADKAKSEAREARDAREREAAVAAARGEDSPLGRALAACRKGRVGDLRAALKEGFDLEALDAQGFSCAALAAKEGKAKCLRILLGAGAYPAARDAAGRTPLHFASVGWDECVEARLAKGADVEVRDDYGRTPLGWAAASMAPGAVGLLLAAGADVSAVDSEGSSPLSLALREWQSRSEAWAQVKDGSLTSYGFMASDADAMFASIMGALVEALAKSESDSGIGQGSCAGSIREWARGEPDRDFAALVISVVESKILDAVLGPKDPSAPKSSARL